MASFAVRMASLALTAALAAAVPVCAVAQGTPAAAPTQVHYSTAITSAYGSQYPTAGHLDLEIFPSGILRGYYHNAFQKAFIQVAGGRDGNYIWFDIGPTLVDLGLGISPGDRLHVVATVNNDNSFRGQIYPEASAADTGQAMGFSRAQGSPNQFIFSAKPIDKSTEDYPGTY